MVVDRKEIRITPFRCYPLATIRKASFGIMLSLALPLVAQPNKMRTCGAPQNVRTDVERALNLALASARQIKSDYVRTTMI
jgi:hypothetical protein